MTPKPDTPISVLVVDDDAQIRELLHAFLEQIGMTVVLAESAEEALGNDHLEGVQVAMLDVRLPGEIDGHQLQKELNRRYPDMAKILMSGQADLEDAIAAFSEQAFSFLKKPFTSLREVGILIERAAEAQQLKIQNREYARQLREANLALSERVSERSATAERYERMLSHLYHVSNRIGTLDKPDTLLDFLCRAVVEAGAFRRAVILLADDKFRVRHVGTWQEDGVPDALRHKLQGLLGQPLRPFEFERSEESVGPAVYARPIRADSDAPEADQNLWQTGAQLFVPILRQDGATLGFLTVEAPQDDSRPSKEIVQLLDVLLGHGSIHLEAQELRDELKRRADELELRVHERTRELRLSEERFSRLVNSTTDIVYVTDENDKLTFLNDAFTRSLGYVRENYIGRTMRRLLEDLATDNPINHRALQELAAQAGEHEIHHVEILTRQGDKRTLEINRTIIKQGGTAKGSQGIIRDITEHRILLQQLVNSERLAATGRLAAGVAHEINNPLQAMSAQLNAILQKVNRRENAEENIEIVRESIERIRYIVRSMLDLHRNPAAAESPVNLNEIADKVVALVGQQLKAHNVVAKMKTAADFPTVRGSSQEIQQVVLNLVVNAIEAMPGGGDLHVSTHFDNDIVALTVRDTGLGISAEHLPQIFEPFFTFKASGLGTGLGLYLSKNIIEAHGGKITVMSDKGKGARFTISLPRR